MWHHCQLGGVSSWYGVLSVIDMGFGRVGSLLLPSPP